MKARKSKKIMKQVSPPEVHNKSRVYWHRYNNSYLYAQRLYRRLIRKKRKNGEIIWSDLELDKLIDEIFNDELILVKN